MLNCGKHECPAICHAEGCEPCDVTITQSEKLRSSVLVHKLVAYVTNFVFKKSKLLVEGSVGEEYVSLVAAASGVK